LVRRLAQALGAAQQEVSQVAAFFSFMAMMFAVIALSKIESLHKDVKALLERDKQ
jgi:hypothetical protein